MSTQVLLLTGLLFGVPPEPVAPAAPRLAWDKGFEISWKGTFSEAILRSHVRAFREYELETRLFVLDLTEKGADVALFCSVRLKPELKNQPETPPIVRLELARIHGDGQLTWLPPASLQAVPEKRQPELWPLQPLEGLPGVETRVVAPFPPGPIHLGQSWKINEEKRPSIKFRLEGFDSVHGSRCYKISANQETDDWAKPRSETARWRRAETICVSVKHGWATRVERTIEKMDAQSNEIGFRSKLLVEQSGTMRYPDRFGADRQAEIAAAAEFQARFDHAIADVTRVDGRPFEQLAQQIEQHIVSHFAGEATPYRQAIESVKRKAEAAARGHIPPQPPAAETSEAIVLAAGKPAPAVRVVDLATGEGVRWGGLEGRAVLLCYYQPASVRTAEPVLRFAQTLADRHGAQAYILPIAIGGSSLAREQRRKLELTIPILASGEAHRVHGIAETPTFALIDPAGVVRAVHVGWSDETMTKVRDEFPKLIR
jgi:hypothetical protein